MFGSIYKKYKSSEPVSFALCKTNTKAFYVMFLQIYTQTESQQFHNADQSFDHGYKLHTLEYCSPCSSRRRSAIMIDLRRTEVLCTEMLLVAPSVNVWINRFLEDGQRSWRHVHMWLSGSCASYAFKMKVSFENTDISQASTVELLHLQFWYNHGHTIALIDTIG